jgi:hypothetical protein
MRHLGHTLGQGADAEAGRDCDLERLTWMWDVTTIEDTKIIIDNQKGVTLKVARAAPGGFRYASRARAGHGSRLPFVPPFLEGVAHDLP